MRYTGHGFIKGIPARDLTDAEVKKFGKERLLASGIYIEKRPARVQVIKEASDDEWNQSIKTDPDQ